MEVDGFQEEDIRPAVAGLVLANPVFVGIVFFSLFFGGLLFVFCHQTPASNGLQDKFRRVAPEAVVGLACELGKFVELDVGYGLGGVVGPSRGGGRGFARHFELEERGKILKRI